VNEINASLSIHEPVTACSGLGIAHVGAMIGGLIHRGRSLSTVLNNLCKLIDAATQGHSSSVLLFDRTHTRIRHVIGPGLPPAYNALLEGRPVNCDKWPPGAAADDKAEAIVSRLMADTLQEGTLLSLVYGLKSCRCWPIGSLSGESLGILAIYQHETNSAAPFHPALARQLTDIASIAIERTRSHEALKRSEALLAKAQRLSSTGSFCWQVATNEITSSEELHRIFEIDQAVPVTLEQMATRVHPEDVPMVRAMFERARSDGSDLDYKHRLQMPDRSVKYLRVVANAARDQDGQLEYIGAIQDVTQRRLGEQALDKLRSELAHVARVTSLSALTASIAHEVNQPLLGIITNASTCRRALAADPPDLDCARETTRRAIRDCQRASDVISRLRALFAKKSCTTELVDLNEATREVIALLTSELQRRGTTLHLDLADDLPAVKGDRVQLQQVILNLLLNAAEAMNAIDDRPRQLTISTGRDEGECECVRLSVKDAGVGLEPKDVDRLFDAFYTTKSSGMGIGLSVSRSIVECHRGRLWAQANKGPGATFSFSLPQASESTPHGGYLSASRNPALAECAVENS
jgi:signal transduction histidine kinase